MTTFSIIKKMSCVGIAAVLCSCSDNTSGIWKGTCSNITSGGMTADVTAHIVVSGKKVSGSLIIEGKALVGSGELKGNIANNTISFIVDSNNGMFNPLIWTGTISGDTITGIYRTEPNLKGTEMRIPPQDGRFTLTRETPPAAK